MHVFHASLCGQVIERFHGYAPTTTIDDQPVMVSPVHSPAASASAVGDAAKFPDADAAA
jgi:hypothetical protein